MAKFSKILTIVNGKNQSKVENPNGRYPIYGSGGVMGYADDYLCEAETVVIGRKGSINKPIYVEEPFWNVDTAFGLVANHDLLLPKYLFYFCVHFDFEQLNTTVTIPSLTKANLLNIEMMLPSLAVQREIVDRLSKVDKLIALRKEQLAKLDQLVKSRFIELFDNEEYEKVTVSSVLNTGFWLMPATPEFIVDGKVPYITSKNIKSRTIDFDNVKYISREAYQSISANRPTQKGDILISMIGTLGQTAVIQDDREFYGQNLYLLRLNSSIIDTT